MAANTAQRHLASRKPWKVQVSTANPNRDGSGTIETLATGTAAGTKIVLVRVVAEGATKKGVLRMFLSDGSTWDLYKEFLVPESAPTLEKPVFTVNEPMGEFVLDTGWLLGFSTQVGDVFNAFAQGGNY